MYVYIGGWGNEAFMVPPTGKSCSVFVSCVTCVRSCARVIRGTRGLRRSGVLLLLLLLLLLLPRSGSRVCSVVVPWVVPWLSRGCPTWLSRLVVPPGSPWASRDVRKLRGRHRLLACPSPNTTCIVHSRLSERPACGC